MTLPPPFRATISGLAGTHPLDLARQFAARSVLAAYYTSLPVSRTPGVPSTLARRHLALLLPIHGLIHGWAPLSPQRLNRLIDHEFDRWASRRLVDADVTHAVAGLGLRQRRAAKKQFNALTVCDSGTTHVRAQQALQDAEHDRWGAEPVPWDGRSIAGIEQEYDESDLIVVPSRFAYQTFVNRGIPAQKVALVPYGVDADVYRPVPKMDQTFRILFVGTLSLRKGFPYLLDAVTALNWRDAELTLRGSETPESRRLLDAYRGATRISVVPPQPRGRLKELYSNASVLVLPSIEDGFGLVIGQALACGTPVIASTNTGGPDIIEDGKNGLIVPAGDSRALQDAMTRLRDDPTLLAGMRVEARNRVERARGWGEYGDRMVNAFVQALKDRGTALP
jgi:glycosyltransferase involved in cell wall biosynthesis